MKTGAFESQREQRWKEIEEILDAAEAGRADPRVVEVPRRFREACSDLALAQARIYRLPLIERLNRLVIRCQQFVYRRRSRIGWEPVVGFVGGGFPAAVRSEWRLFWLCSAMFWLPFLGMMLAVDGNLTWAQAVLGPEGMASMDAMYGDSDSQVEHLRRPDGSNFMMFCFYIQNNIGIDFKIFAGGIAACLDDLLHGLQRCLSGGGGGLCERGGQSRDVLDLCQRAFVVGTDRDGGGGDGGDAAGLGGVESGAAEARRGDPGGGEAGAAAALRGGADDLDGGGGGGVLVGAAAAGGTEVCGRGSRLGGDDSLSAAGGKEGPA